VVETKDIGELPDYVINDIKTATFVGKMATKSNWVIEATYWAYNDGDKVKTRIEKEAAELTNKLERVLAWQVAQELISVLRTIGYTVNTTRESVLDGMKIAARKTIIHGFNPDYLISLHCDGDTNYTQSGAHAIYRVDKKGKDFSEQQSSFAEDIIAAYGEANIIEVLSPSIRRRGDDVGILSPKDSPKLVRKTLLEMGFGSNPADYNAIYNNRKELARQIAIGLERNVNTNFGVLSNEIIGFQTPGGKTVLYKVPQDDKNNGGGKTKNNAVYRVDNLPQPPAF
jgi:N-acetylmuramoyl-L-alanine amidase